MTTITIPFPLWHFLSETQEEIAKLLNKKFNTKWAPEGTPRSIEFKSIPHEEDECDRLKIKLWYPMGTYVTAIIGGHESSYGTYWDLVSYKARWTFWRSEKEIRCEVIAEGEAAGWLSSTAHIYKEVTSEIVLERHLEESLHTLRSYDIIREEERS